MPWLLGVWRLVEGRCRFRVLAQLALSGTPTAQKGGLAAVPVSAPPTTIASVFVALLSIVALLAAADWVEFAFIRDHLGLSDSALSKQLSTLEEAGYVHIERPVSDSRRRVRARLTRAGRSAFQGHVAALRAIVGAGDPQSAVG